MSKRKMPDYVPRFAALAAQLHRLNADAGHNLLGFEQPTNMPADALAVYEAANARHRARFGKHPGVNPYAHSSVGATDQASQLINARHHARFGA